ncbi:metalloregulator ArsR/SmtB family transcription factor [Phyllobacterium sp. 21LDTY02-6]|uniref:ArsR/SmtB family transcription factor n=1 Tax=unclassified Phyllobacterium TaxID=2638441 RepID=UPI0020227376|nr:MULTISPECIES: metalloregulator ArsR/SmtB family transcription factor [unclassified Phyllobacterium]MCO4319771.1 metalloregulator ArsR/SmtB family transcription factor [Phyllobacterium sp. 21LDTY02-6]MCX8280512.1 metalloregulator ArsR/SmtB family transcription factor [Phyllobacterium sp. 0TCS1.6C]MCX8295039.1 metalloregulator ArsR/SmtB family transcription factor [Phyllobacterium sp. 0TCS1.6A]
MARLLAALAHPARLNIIRQLSCQDSSCCKDIVAGLDLAQSTVSQHLKVLMEAGLVQLQQSGQCSWYSLRPETFADAAAAVAGMAELCCSRSSSPVAHAARPAIERIQVLEDR